MPGELVRVAHTDELSPGEKKLVLVGDERILLVNVDGNYYAMDDLCTHALAYLSMGQLYGNEVVCPVHGSEFNVKTGEVLCPPATEDIPTYPVSVDGTDILIEFPGT